MSVLVIAPGEQGLNVERDLRAAGGASEIKALVGLVSRREALAEIASGRHSIVHLAGHGSRFGFAVSDGEISGHVLRQAVAAGGVSLLVLNWCVSVPLAAAVHGQGVSKVISWRDDVADDQAGRWAQWFYRSYGICGDVWEAYQTACEAFEDAFPGAEIPIWLNGRLALMQAQIAELQAAQLGRAHDRRLTVVWLGVVLGLLVVDGVLSIAEIRQAIGLPPLIAAPGRALLLFSVLVVVLGRLGVLQRG